MARRHTWTDVRGGLIACLVLVVIAVGVLTFMRVGALHGDTFLMYALVGEARGVAAGSEVWLNGQKIGKITTIRFRTPAVGDSTQRIEIQMEVLEQHRKVLRRDAVAQIRAGGSVIGPPVVYLSAGSTRAAQLQPGDTVRTLVQTDAEGATVQFNAAAKEIPVILSNVKEMRSQLTSSEGTMGAILNGPGLAQLTRARAQASRLMQRVSSGSGSLGPIMNGGLSSRAARAMARVDSVRALLASSRTSVGRFRRDSSLMKAVSDVRSELAVVQTLLNEPRGTIGRARTDSALTVSLGQAREEMTLLLADIKKNPRRYISAAF